MIAGSIFPRFPVNAPMPAGTKEPAMTKHVDSASDARTANNAVRHAYRVLSDEEKAQMVAVKDKGAEFLNLLDDIATGAPGSAPGAAVGSNHRELSIARERIEEAVMWAVKHVTA